ncbi:hypothetical protein O6H91_06G061300 [Diphasiastrum complanatum]|uniref:Uncharacterized protein n=2 Tax=Diphasiastrum complanatum TaxID=34168 RepID=A0ACC2DEB9_DIPCM|nr:hypothetical protein O6H91_06G061300 [Diphasiastrum complanatum]KAJ7552601.1 hypothetical protein O6H91_06G061300 [Diphasiastrum complanatum]
MHGATKIALAATVGNLLQGWDNGAIAGALLYLKPEFGLEKNPTLEGLIVAATLVGAWLSTLCSGPGADWIGRRLMLCLSGAIFSVSACAMLWSPNVYLLLVSRVLVGTSIGLAVTIIPIYIAETSPSEIRGQLATLPQLMGSGGLFLVYVMVFILSLTRNPNWRLMLGALLLPSLVFLGLALFYLPESPRWLVSKGRMSEAKRVLQQLRNKTDVAAELALLVEGLGVGAASFEEWLLQPAESGFEDVPFSDDGHIKVYNPDEGVTWIAKSYTDDTGTRGLLSRRPTAEPNSLPFVDPVVSIFGSFRSTTEFRPDYQQESLEDAKNEQWEEESHQRTPRAHGYQPEDGMVGDMDETLTTPLLSRAASGKLDMPPVSRSNSQKTGTHETSVYGTVTQGGLQDYLGTVGSVRGGHSVTQGSIHDYLGSVGSRRNSKLDQAPSFRSSSRNWRRDSQSSMGMRHGSFRQGNMPVGSIPDSMASVGIGGGWQLAWRWTGPEDQEANNEMGGFKRVFLRQESTDHAHSGSALSLPGVAGLETESIPAAALVGQPAQSMKNILSVGPAMVHPAETAVQGPAWSDLLEGGVRRALIVGVGLQILQQLMDQSGRRQLLLATLPLLFISLIGLVLSSVLPTGIIQAAASFVGVTVYVCTFVMGFGPVPNILCSEIFPTRVRGVCIGLCQATFWICNLIVTYAFPVLLLVVGIRGVFGIFAVVSLLSWLFVFLKVPETKGMPLEVISEFFAMSAAAQPRPHATEENY